MEKKVELPDINYLIKKGKEDPAYLLKIRDDLVNIIINRQKCEKKREKLNNFQIYINMIEKSSNNHLHACIKISKLMEEKLQDFNNILNYGEIVSKENKENKVIFYKF